MDKDIIDRLRKLRKTAADLSRTIDDDLKHFRHKLDQVTFRRRPSSGSDRNDVGVTTTCSCLMALAISGKLNNFYENPEKIKTAFDYVMKGDYADEWKSSELEPCNAFTTTLVLRAFGFLKQVSAPGITSPDDFKHEKYPRCDDKSLTGIIKDLVEDPDNRFKINEYPATPTIIYWFVDSIQRATVRLQPNEWKNLFAWAAKSFLCQLSRVSAKQEALMDPIAMAMAACLSAKLRSIAKGAKLGASPDLLAYLPSMIELKNSIYILFEEFQSDCGIWPKYFPLFHYGRDAGSNYCFTFEMLEAILNEFGEGILIDNNIILPRLKNAVQWCCDNRMDYLQDGENYSGWNSGGLLQTLEAGEPESWATAVVHMFLYTLQEVLTDRIENLILSHYSAKRYDNADSEEWDRLLDIDLELEQTKEKITVKDLLNREVLSTITTGDRRHFRHNPIKGSRSALLFGPPGTSKTVLVKAIAQKLGWPYIAIDPSHFLKKGLESIYSEADNVFRDLSDLSGTVLLFDEMDALVQTRDENQGYNFDVTSRFLTTSMLPKLATLHDNGRSIFFMATNYPEQFDQAIKRPGRFDLLLCTWPPSWKTKLERLYAFYKESDVDECREILREYVDGTSQKGLLDMFTYGEMKTFIGNLKGTSDLKRILENLGKDDFLAKVDRWAKCITLNVSTKKDKDITEKYIAARKGSRLQL